MADFAYNLACTQRVAFVVIPRCIHSIVHLFIAIIAAMSVVLSVTSLRVRISDILALGFTQNFMYCANLMSRGESAGIANLKAKGIGSGVGKGMNQTIEPWYNF